MTDEAAGERHNLTGGLWLLSDMALNIWALSIVKALGLGYSAFQLVFLRALVGFLIMLPWIIRSRGSFHTIGSWRLQGLRVLFSTLALTAGFFAIARLPFALVTAISFIRPFMMMAMAMLILHERVPGKRWIAAGIAFAGVLIAVEPGTITFNWGLPVMFLTVIFGTSAIIVTRRLPEVPTVVMMTFYTAGLSLLTAPFALLTWTTFDPAHTIPLLAIGLFAQSAQYCFLQAHRRAEAGYLAVLSYTSLIITTAVGYFIFDEVPTLPFALGAAMIVAAALWTTLSTRTSRQIGRGHAPASVALPPVSRSGEDKRPENQRTSR